MCYAFNYCTMNGCAEPPTPNKGLDLWLLLAFVFVGCFPLETVLPNALPKRLGCNLIEAKEVAYVFSQHSRVGFCF